MAIYDIDLLRALFVDKLNDNTIFLASFYEQLQDDEQINRYVDSIKELLALQNREKSESNYKAMGIIAQSGNAEIINIKQNYISPLEYQARFDIELTDRDYVLGKLKTLINDLRGRKFDISLQNNGSVAVFGEPTQIITSLNPLNTEFPIAYAAFNKMYINYFGSNPEQFPTSYQQAVRNTALFYKNFTGNQFLTYYNFNGNLYSTIYSFQSWSAQETNITSFVSSPEQITLFAINQSFVSEVIQNFLNSGISHRAVLKINIGNKFEPVFYSVVLGSQTITTPILIGANPVFYKLSLSFDGIQSQEPYINNGVDRIFLFFGGSATIVESKVSLGNDIISTTIQVGKNNGAIYEVEPTEIPASLSVSDDTFQTYANGYRTQDRNLAIGNKMAYSFIYDNTNALYNDLYTYARFGTNAGTYAQQIFTIKEYRYFFGVLNTNTFFAKLGDVSTSNTNGDVMTISVSFKIGDY
jgi:hypothetical protein